MTCCKLCRVTFEEHPCMFDCSNSKCVCHLPPEPKKCCPQCENYIELYERSECIDLDCPCHTKTSDEDVMEEYDRLFVASGGYTNHEATDDTKSFILSALQKARQSGVLEGYKQATDDIKFDEKEVFNAGVEATIERMGLFVAGTPWNEMVSQLRKELIKSND